VREYNANWDFFKGMSPGEIEQHMHKNAIWDRPTWRMTEAGATEERTREKIYAHFARGESVFGDFSMNGEAEETARERDARIDIGTIPHPTIEALNVLGLAPPVGWDDVKSRYKSLVKKYHPDTSTEKGAEEQLKKINMAYTILKLSYQTYSQLDER
jgi:DnaJ-domain-containing protein 1